MFPCGASSVPGGLRLPYHPPMTRLALLGGAVAALAARTLVLRAIVTKLRRDVARLNAGDHRPLLGGYARDAVIRFDRGAHRWSGHHRGPAAVERFLRDFTNAGLQGEIRDVWMAGPPWALTLVARFDDRASGPDGSELYANRAVLVVRTRWGRIVEQEDFYEDTRRIDAFEKDLIALGVERVPRDPLQSSPP